MMQTRGHSGGGTHLCFEPDFGFRLSLGRPYYYATGTLFTTSNTPSLLPALFFTITTTGTLLLLALFLLPLPALFCFYGTILLLSAFAVLLLPAFLDTSPGRKAFGRLTRTSGRGPRINRSAVLDPLKSMTSTGIAPISKMHSPPRLGDSIPCSWKGCG